MLEFVKDNKKVRLWYQFDSSYVDEGYEKYDFDEFHYDIDIDEIKETLAYELFEIVKEDEECSSNIILKTLNELDGWEVLDWFKVIKKAEDILKESYKQEAMDYFAENHYEMTKDDYESYRCE